MKKALKITLAAALATVVFAGAGVAAAKAGAGTDMFAQPAAYAAVLKQGARGGEVKEVQRRLKNWGYYSGSVDGIYGPATVKAVKSFQKKNGLSADGICGKATYAALGMNDSVRVLENGDKDAPSGGAVRGLPTTPVQICTFWRAAFTARRAARAIRAKWPWARWF